MKELFSFVMLTLVIIELTACVTLSIAQPTANTSQTDLMNSQLVEKDNTRNTTFDFEQSVEGSGYFLTYKYTQLNSSDINESQHLMLKDYVHGSGYIGIKIGIEVELHNDDIYANPNDGTEIWVDEKYCGNCNETHPKIVYVRPRSVICLKHFGDIIKLELSPLDLPKTFSISQDKPSEPIKITSSIETEIWVDEKYCGNCNETHPKIIYVRKRSKIAFKQSDIFLNLNLSSSHSEILVPISLSLFKTISIPSIWQFR